MVACLGRCTMYTQISNPMDYRVAFYIRLSKEDDNEKESESVTNQRSLLNTFAEEYRLDVFKTYVDDGYSGTSFNRPDFQRMIKDIEEGKVNMVVTKDMSRLGRDYIQTGYYLERFFPEKRVRYISLLDGVDTGIDNSINDITPFKAIMNDMYAKDISKKITSVKRDKQKKGLFIGGKAVYGYKLSPDEKNKIIIDDGAAPIVKRIFAYAVDGKSCREIATILNNQKIPSPASYANLPIARKGPYSGLWSSERVSDMLQNQTYIGHMVQGKTKKINYKSEKCIKMKRKDWIVVENTHTSLIDEEIFYKVQTLVASRKTTRMRTYDYLLKGIIHCHECGYPLAVVNRPNAKGEDVLYFICRTYQRFTQANVCTCHAVKEATVTKAVLEKIALLCESYMNEAELVSLGEKSYDEFIRNNGIEDETERINAKISVISANMDKIYMDKLSGVLVETDFIRIYNRMKDERSALEQKLSSLKQTKRKSSKQKTEQVKELVKRFIGEKDHRRELLLSLVEKVELTAEKEVIIHFKCM